MLDGTINGTFKITSYYLGILVLTFHLLFYFLVICTMILDQCLIPTRDNPRRVDLVTFVFIFSSFIVFFALTEINAY